jgi:DNA invertase Pin-like site-specific DNA recombinase
MVTPTPEVWDPDRIAHTPAPGVGTLIGIARRLPGWGPGPAALDELVTDARRRRFDVLAWWRLDRLGRNLRHLVLLLEELHALGVSFASLNEGIDATAPAGRLQMHMLAALSEFERGRIQERVRAGLARAKRRVARIGRPGVASALKPSGASTG